MPADVNQQTMVFLACVITGALSGIIYDFLSTLAKVLKFKKAEMFFLDICIWIVSISAFFTVIYTIDGAQLRWYVFLGALMGGLLYLVTIRIVVIKTLSALFRFIAEILMQIVRFFNLPLRLIKRMLRPLNKYVQTARKKSSNFVKKNIEKFRRFKILLKKV